MNDDPTENRRRDPGETRATTGSSGDAPGDAGALDDTQPIEVQRFAPTPDPRPDDRWAWAAPAATPPPDRWYEPAPSEPGPAAAGYTGGRLRSGWPGGVPVEPSRGPPRLRSRRRRPRRPAPAERRGGAGIGTIVVAALLSAVLASGGTVLILDRTGALDRPAAVHRPPASAQPVSGQQPVTIDESSAVIDAAAKVGPAVVKITVDGQSTDPFGSVPTEGIGSGIIYDASGWILTNRHVVTGADKLTVELKDGRKFAGHRLRHRHPDRPRHRQGRRDRPARPRRSATRTASRSASSWSPSAARSAPTRSR